MLFTEKEKENHELKKLKCEQCGLEFSELTEEEEYHNVDEEGLCLSCQKEIEIII